MDNAMGDELAVGSTVWMFDHNRRVYREDERGRSQGAPIYREHWRPIEIAGEDRLNWVTSRGKFPKKPRKGQFAGIRFPGFGGLRIARTLTEVDDDIWANGYRHFIARAVEQADPATLRKVAELIGWTEPVCR